MECENRRGSGELLHQHEEHVGPTQEAGSEVPHVDQEEEGLAGWSSWSIDSTRSNLFQGEEWETYERMRTDHRTDIDRIRAENILRADRTKRSTRTEKESPATKRRKLADQEEDLLSAEDYYEDWLARNASSWRAVPSNYPGGGGGH